MLAVAGCQADPVGVGDLTLVVEGASADSAWTAAPGADTLVRVRLYDLEGAPVAGAQVSWVPAGTGSNVSALSGVSDRQGYAVARWRIGTDARDRQELRLTARRGSALRELVIRGRVIPSVVSSLRLATDEPLVARLGDTLHCSVVAVDPFGNAFPAPDLKLTVSDSAYGTVVDSVLVAGPRRGRAVLRALSGTTAAFFPLEVVQRVATIELALDTLRFTSLLAELPIVSVVRDDRGLIISDTVPMLQVSDTAIAQIAGDRVRAVGPGGTRVFVTLGNATAALPVNVQQRIASLRLIRDTVHFDALSDTTTLRAVAYDSLGSRIRQPALEYQTSTAGVVRMVGRTVEALSPGATLVTAIDPVTGLSASLEVVVRQRVVAIDMPVTDLVFDAIDASAIAAAVARDRLGSPVADAQLAFAVTDTAVAVLDSGSNRVRAVAPGVTTVTVRDAESDVVASRTVRVEQIAQSLSARVVDSAPVLSLPVGASVALECTAADRNGFAVTQPVMVRAVNGTVAGTCADARVLRSGYDTLVFALGTAEAQVPVIVATSGDSVRVIAAPQPQSPFTAQQFLGEDLANPMILALRPLVTEILAAYGNPVSSLDRARAIRDWVARTAIHPDVTLHPDSSSANLTVLPSGATWADVNRLGPPKWDADVAFWTAFYADGYAMLDGLLGTLDPATGARAANGMMEYVGGARYRIRDLETYRYVACSYQSMMLNTLWAAAGLHGIVVNILNHDPAAVFIPEEGRWVYEDPTYNEEYLLDGVGAPLAPTDLFDLSNAGQAGRFYAAKLTGPTFDRMPYISGRRYLDAGHPEGMMIMGGGLYRRVVGTAGMWGARFVQIDGPALTAAPAPFNDATVYAPVTSSVAFPTLGPAFDQIWVEDSVHVVRLSSTFPGHLRFERRLNSGAWVSVSDTDVLPVGSCRVEYRSLDTVGAVSASAVLDVWIPRAEQFIQRAPAGTLRAQSQLCIASPIQ